MTDKFDFFKDAVEEPPSLPSSPTSGGLDFFAESEAPVKTSKGKKPKLLKTAPTEQRFTHSNRPVSKATVPELLDYGKDMLLTGPLAGLQKGAIGVVSLPGNIEGLGRLGLNKGWEFLGSDARVDETPALPDYEDVKDAYERNLWPITEPETPGGEVFSTLAEWGSGGTGSSVVKAPIAGAKALAGNTKGAISLMKQAAKADRAGATLGVIGGGVAEGVNSLIDDDALAAGTGLAAMVPLSVILNRQAATPASILRKHGGVDNITPEQWEAARLREAQAKARGIPLLGPEAIDSELLSRLAGDVGMMPGGAPPIASFVEPRFGQVRAGVDKLAEEISGKPVSVLRNQRPDELAEAISAKSAQGVDAPRKQAAQKSQPHFDAIRAQDVTPDVVQKFLDDLPTPRKGQEPSPVERIADHIRKRLTYEVEVPDPADPTKTIVKRVPETNLGRIHDALMEFKDNTRVAPGVQLTDESVKNRQAWREFWGKSGQGSKGRLLDFQNDLRGVNPDYESAWAAYDAVTPQRKAWEGSRSNILADADAKGRKAGTPASDLFTKINTELFGTKDRIPTVAEFRDATKALMQQDPNGQLLADLTATALLRNLEKAGKATQATDAPRTVGANLAKTAQGSQDSARRVLNNEVLATIAKARGLNVQQLQAAWNNTMDILQRTGKIPGVGSPTAQRGQLADTARTNFRTQASDLLANPQGAGQKLVNLLFTDLGEAGERAVYEKLAKAFTDPNSSVAAIQKLAKLGTSPENRMRALQVLLQGQRELSQEEDD